MDYKMAKPKKFEKIFGWRKILSRKLVYELWGT